MLSAEIRPTHSSTLTCYAELRTLPSQLLLSPGVKYCLEWGRSPMFFSRSTLMLIRSRLLLPSLVAGLLFANTGFTQPPGWGGDRGSSSWGSRGPGGDYGGFRGGPPGGGWGGGPPSFGGFPGGGFPGGGFNPADMVRRADTNNNNTIEPEEFQNGWGRMVQRMADRAGMNTNQPVRVDALIAAVDPSRSSSSSSSSGSGATASTNSQSFSS